MLITPARQQVIDFSGPIHAYGEGLIMPAADHRGITYAKELAGGTVSAQVGNTHIEPLRKLGALADVKVYALFRQQIGGAADMLPSANPPSPGSWQESQAAAQG